MLFSKSFKAESYTIIERLFLDSSNFLSKPRLVLVQHFEPSNMIARVFYSKLLQKLELGSSDSEVEDEMSEENDEEDIEENESVSNDSNSSCDEQPTDEENANKVDEKCHPLKKNMK